jgi:hypothetical protein
VKLRLEAYLFGIPMVIGALGWIVREVVNVLWR